ncbi:MAG TPA: HypC/HybG/HupF family hydrogenase formation chaperone [Nitrososphaeria archaeon]|nr:MAG: HypC/HybG/HupF family hydrogenase formation chaperone [Nitrososphaerota archaeon]HDJ66106.1 HypC/HybG/HupF family hydrogenase formation chaperone [Nitrososphaeria archaeon]
MCYAIPGKVIKIDGEIGIVDFGNGVRREVVLAMVNAKLGDYVLVHAGYAIKILNEEEAKKTLELYSQILNLVEGH